MDYEMVEQRKAAARRIVKDALGALLWFVEPAFLQDAGVPDDIISRAIECRGLTMPSRNAYKASVLLVSNGLSQQDALEASIGLAMIASIGVDDLPATAEEIYGRMKDTNNGIHNFIEGMLRGAEANAQTYVADTDPYGTLLDVWELTHNQGAEHLRLAINDKRKQRRTPPAKSASSGGGTARAPENPNADQNI